MTQPTATFTGALATYPARAACLYYLLLIFVGTLLLWSPVALHPSRDPRTQAISLNEAVFTATSAACVTGLTVRSTGEDFSLFGQVVILLLIQLGGIGIMTVTTFTLVTFGQRESLRQRALMQQTVGLSTDQGLQPLLVRVLGFVLLTEIAGFVLLAGWLLLRQAYHPEVGITAADVLYDALFHTVSAFCNAGFSLFSDSLTRYQGDVPVNLIISGLIILGGLGFPVVLDVLDPSHTPGRRWEQCSLHTKVVLLGTATLIVLGTVAWTALEWSNTLAGMSWGKRLLVGFFHSVSARTAGFNTTPTSQLTNTTLFVATVLMFIGGGPCSTAGGAKVTTIGLLGLHSWARCRGESQLTLFRRKITSDTIDRAFAVLGLLALCGIGGLLAVLAADDQRFLTGEPHGPFLAALFEVTSALATTGLSSGYVATAGEFDRWVFIGLMFVGRVGPLSFFGAFARSQHSSHLQYASGEVLMG